MLGGIKNIYSVMLAGRVIFGLGGECMSVSQSAIISAWFKGKELGFALGLNITVARLASVVGGVLIPVLILNDDGLINSTMIVGLAICIFSLIAGILLVFMDWYADKKDGKINMVIPDEEKFHWGDLLTFGFPFWLASFSCMFVYMSVFTYIQTSAKMAQVKFGFDSVSAGKVYSIPYFMSAFLSPLLGFVIDKVGKRALFIMLSSIFAAMACFWVAIMPDYASPNFIIIGPEILMGICYSIFASALWSSIPYLV